MHRLVVAVMVVCASATLVSAGPAGIALELVEGCPDRAGFIQLVEQHAGAPLPAEAQARVAVEREGGRWSALVELAGAPSRRLDGASCAEVLDAAALVVALSIDLPGADGEPQADRQPAPGAESEPATNPVVRLTRRSAAPLRPIDLRLGAGAVGDASTLPRAAIAANVAASVRRGLHSIDLSFALFRATRASAPGGDGEVAPMGLWTIGLRACRQVSVASICLGGEAGRMSTDSRRLADGRKVGALWAAATASGWIRRRISGSLGVYAGLEAVGGVSRPRFVLDDDTALHRSAAASGRVLVGVEFDAW